MLTRRAAIAAAVACACASLACAGERPVTRVAPDAVAYSSVDEAAVAALAMAVPLSTRFEYGGAILKCSGAYYFTEPVTSRRNARVEFDTRIGAGCSLAAIYHTHPEGERSSRFSRGDMNVAHELGVPSFIGVIADSSVRRYDPRSMAGAANVGRLKNEAAHSGVLIATLETH